ncbi:MAG TPA: RNA polymerase sigma factor [Ilumatobacter sp.]|nr:RNA polymerase sigma factor [Ilumatobacter sp.]
MHAIAITQPTTQPTVPRHPVPTNSSPTDSSDIELTHTASFEEMYRREYPGLVAVASALAGQDGPDIVHDAMVRALLHWNKVAGYERPGGWCHRVVVNLCRSRFRRRTTERRWLAHQRGDELVSAGPSADVIAFWEAVRRLPERPRLVVTLYYAGDHSVAEVANILDVPEGTVKSDLSRAREALSRELN